MRRIKVAAFQLSPREIQEAIIKLRTEWQETSHTKKNGEKEWLV